MTVTYHLTMLLDEEYGAIGRGIILSFYRGVDDHSLLDYDFAVFVLLCIMPYFVINNLFLEFLI